MVLPATEMALRQQDRRLRRIHRKHIEVDDEVLKSVARQEAEQAALFALHKLFDPESTDVKRPLSSTIASAAKSASEKRGTVGRYEPLASTDIAVHRGSLRALGETNESGFLGSLAQSGDFDLTTVTEEVTNGTVEARKSQEAKKKKNGFKSLAKKFTWGNNRKGVKIEQLPKLFSGISKEAWMCGCCGKVFSTYEAADYHETRCIQAALGAVGNGTNNEDALAIPQDSQSLSSIAIASIGVERRFAGGKVDDDLMRDIGLGDDHVMVDNSRISRFGQSSSIYASARNEGENVGDLDWGLVSPISQRDKVSLLQNQGYLREVDVSFSDHVRGVGPQLDHSSGRRRMSNGPRRDPNEPEDILLTSSMRHGITETDEALKNAVERATGLLLSQQHIDAERDLKFIASGMAYYQEMSERASLLKAHPRIKYKTDGKTAREKIQNKFVDAWQLIKEGDGENDPLRDQYEKKSRRDNEGSGELVHDQNTHYINVFVKHSARVVTSELERIARQRWIDQVEGSAESKDNFEQFRKFAHFNLVKFAKLALSVDFTPRKVAVQLSNDLYRLISPQLKRRGVTIETEIEYRVGQYFVLAVNVKSISWTKLIKYSHRLIAKRRKDWEADQIRRDELREDLAAEENRLARSENDVGPIRGMFRSLRRLFQMTGVDILAQFLSWMYYFPWTISTPICWILFRFFISSTVRKYILSTVADEIFSYVEEKGMEMDIAVVEAERQAAFMLSALRELREGSRERKKQKEAEDKDKGKIYGPLLGPAIKTDKSPAPPPPAGFEMPANLEFINFEVDLPVGFKRLRWALLSAKSNFVRDAVFAEAKYDNINLSDWSKHNDIIGLPTLPDGVKEENIIGAEQQNDYLMPKSTFVKANTVYETGHITAYNDYCFCVKRRTLSPEVPYGSTFVAWTQLLVTNTGNESCHLVCSVEAEFPNGPPMIYRQIISGMRSGTADTFILMGDVIIRHKDEYP